MVACAAAAPSPSFDPTETASKRFFLFSQRSGWVVSILVTPFREPGDHVVHGTHAYDQTVRGRGSRAIKKHKRKQPARKLNSEFQIRTLPIGPELATWLVCKAS